MLSGYRNLARLSKCSPSNSCLTLAGWIFQNQRFQSVRIVEGGDPDAGRHCLQELLVVHPLHKIYPIICHSGYLSSKLWSKKLQWDSELTYGAGNMEAWFYCSIYPQVLLTSLTMIQFPCRTHELQQAQIAAFVTTFAIVGHPMMSQCRFRV